MVRGPPRHGQLGAEGINRGLGFSQSGPGTFKQNLGESKGSRGEERESTGS